MTKKKKQEPESKEDFQQRPVWIFITIIILLIQVAPNCSNLALDFYPELSSFWQGIWKLIFIVFGIFMFGLIYWWDVIQNQESYDPDKISKEERLEKVIRATKWFIWRQNIFKYYPLNILTLRIIPLFICWMISQCINKKYKPYLFHPFDFPADWPNYKSGINIFFKNILRIYIKKLNQNYEVKFKRDFQYIEIRWTDKSTEKKFSDPKNELYEDIFSEDKFKHIAIFTWIFPFGLYWNARRVVKNIFLKKMYIKNRKN